MENGLKLVGSFSGHLHYSARIVSYDAAAADTDLDHLDCVEEGEGECRQD